MEACESLIDRLEDLEDSLAVLRLREHREETIPFTPLATERV